MGLRPRHGVRKAAAVDGFEQVGHGVDFKCAQRI
jgi:hypothetical protein